MRTPLRRYYRGHDQVAIRDVQTDTTRYYHYDHQGTTQALTNRAGAVTDRFASDAWGVQVKRTGNSINRHWYVGNLGYYRSDNSQLMYVRARYLAPRLGCWLTKDMVPALLAYDYADQMPSRLLDPSGLSVSGCTGFDFVYNLNPLKDIPKNIIGDTFGQLWSAVQEARVQLKYQFRVCPVECGCSQNAEKVTNSFSGSLQVSARVKTTCIAPAGILPLINAAFDCYYKATVTGSVGFALVTDPCGKCKEHTDDSFKVEVAIGYEMVSKSKDLGCGVSAEGRGRLQIERRSTCCDGDCSDDVSLNGCIDIRAQLNCGPYQGVFNIMSVCAGTSLT